VIQRVRDIAVHVRVAGAGPRVVLIHGLAQDSRSWCDLQRRLAEFELHAYDLRGHGASELGDADGTLRQLGEDLIGYLEQVGPSAVAGFSLGGTIALWAASERPDLVRHVVAIATSSVVGRVAESFFNERIAMLEGGDWDAFRAAFEADNRGQIAGPQVDRAAVHAARLEAIGSGGGYLNASRAMAALRGDPLTPRLAAIRCRVDVIGGERDTFCPKKAADIMLASLPDATYRELPASGHLMSVDAPEHLAEILRELLQDPGAQ
jgi:pimeloyl-ACP methyl ester carboxylesterase